MHWAGRTDTLAELCEAAIWPRLVASGSKAFSQKEPFIEISHDCRTHAIECSPDN